MFVVNEVLFARSPAGAKGSLSNFSCEKIPHINSFARMPVAEVGMTERSDVIPLVYNLREQRDEFLEIQRVPLFLIPNKITIFTFVLNVIYDKLHNRIFASG